MSAALFLPDRGGTWKQVIEFDERVDSHMVSGGPLSFRQMHRYQYPPSKSPIWRGIPYRKSDEAGERTMMIADAVIRRLERLGPMAVSGNSRNLGQWYANDPSAGAQEIRETIEESPEVDFRIAGFPMRCFQHARVAYRGELTSEWVPIEDSRESFLRGQSFTVLGHTPSVFRVFPIPFGCNVLVLAVVFGGVAAGVGTLKRIARSRAGLCVKCAYPKPFGAMVCPECGEEVGRAGGKQNGETLPPPVKGIGADMGEDE